VTLESGDAGFFRFSDLQLPYETSDECVEHAAKRDDTTEQTACLCEKCLERMQECDVLPGCLEIVACSRETGCNGTYGCYLLPGAPCRDVVDRWGNASLATTVSIEIFDCITQFSCR
jgi:hypothetical protein